MTDEIKPATNELIKAAERAAIESINAIDLAEQETVEVPTCTIRTMAESTLSLIARIEAEKAEIDKKTEQVKYLNGEAERIQGEYDKLVEENERLKSAVAWQKETIASRDKEIEQLRDILRELVYHIESTIGVRNKLTIDEDVFLYDRLLQSARDAMKGADHA